MKVAYFSEYRSGSFSSEIAVDNILALETAGIDVVCRPISLSAFVPKSSCLVKHLESKSLDNIDVIIQHVMPHSYEYKHGIKNIGFLHWNQSTFNRSNWSRCCDLMDEIWVTCSDAMEAAQKSGVKKPIKIVLHGRNSEKFSKKFDPLNLPELDEKCIFYTIAEMTRRQNITGLIRSYYAAFNRHDNVGLLLRLHTLDQDKTQLMATIKRTIEDLKQATHIYPRKEDYPPVFLLCDTLSDEQTMQLHNTGHIFVSCDRGEPWNIFLHDAMGFGRPSVHSDICGQKVLVGGTPWGVEGQNTPCINISEENDTLNTGQDFWFDPSLEDFSKSLQRAYRAWVDGDWEIHSEIRKKRVIDFNYSTVGIRMKKILQEIEIKEGEI